MKELLRSLSAGVEELLNRPGHCSVVVASGSDGTGIAANLRQLFPPGSWQSVLPVRGYSFDDSPCFVIEVNEKDLIFRIEARGRRVFERRFIFDGPEVPL